MTENNEAATSAMGAREWLDEAVPYQFDGSDGAPEGCTTVDKGQLIQLLEAYHAHQSSPLQERITELERSEDDLVGKRDALEDALAETHVALGGDGEWICRIPPQLPPDSGDLKRDVPELARQLQER